MRSKLAIGLWVLLLVCGPAAGATRWTPVGQGRLEIRDRDLQSPREHVPSVAPLKHTDVKIKVRGFVAEVTVTQEFTNPLPRAIEAEYVFPLPQDSAVNATEMRIGRRVIRGKIARRAEARRRYEQAREEGKRASLLEQERANIFTQSVANIAPGETVHVVVRYVQTLPYADGAYELVFPMVVGPRYIPGRPLAAAAEAADRAGDDGTGEAAALPGGRRSGGTGRLADTDRVPDASRITPPVLKPHERCGYDIDLAVDLDTGVPIQDMRSRAHRVEVRRLGESTAAVTLARDDRIPNKDFVLNIATAGTQPEIGFLAHHDGKGGYFTLVLQPPRAPAPEQVRPREVICVMDTSGSMTGRPIDLSRRAVIAILQELRPTDRFNVLVFSNDVAGFQPRAVLASPENVRAGIEYVRTRRASGGTEMLKGVRAALREKLPEGYLRMIALLSDGYIGNEREILAEIRRHGRTARWFSFGIGSSVNRYLLERMASVGRGTAQYALLHDDPQDAANTFLRRIAAPVLTDVEVKIAGVRVSDLTPARAPDVFAGVPVYFHGRYRGGGPAAAEVTGRVGVQPSRARLDVTFPAASKAGSPLPSLWARERIKELEVERLGSNRPEEQVEKITELALAYSLMSAYTSFVAIDETPTALGGRPVTVPVRVPLPEGVSYETTIGPAGGGAVGSSAGSSGRFALRRRGGGGAVGWLVLLAAGGIGLAHATRRRRLR